MVWRVPGEPEQEKLSLGYRYYSPAFHGPLAFEQMEGHEKYNDGRVMTQQQYDDAVDEATRVINYLRGRRNWHTAIVLYYALQSSLRYRLSRYEKRRNERRSADRDRRRYKQFSVQGFQLGKRREPTEGW